MGKPMKKFIMVVGALCALASLPTALPVAAQGVGPPVVSCNKAFQLAAGATSITAIVPSGGTPTSPKTITWCGWTIVGGAAAATIQLSYGTGTNCNGGNVVITPAVAIPINAVLVDHQNWGFASMPQNNDLCLQIVGTGPLSVMVYYSIQ